MAPSVVNDMVKLVTQNPEYSRHLRAMAESGVIYDFALGKDGLLFAYVQESDLKSFHGRKGFTIPPDKALSDADGRKAAEKQDSGKDPRIVLEPGFVIDLGGDAGQDIPNPPDGGEGVSGS